MERKLCFSLQKEEIFYDPNVIASRLLLIRKIAGSSCSGSTATLRLISNTAINIKLDSFLGHALGLVVGVEFIKRMLIRHTPGAVIEVLLFAITRQLIVYHTSTLEPLIGILTVGCAFAIRKFLFVEKIDVDALPLQKNQKSFSGNLNPMLKNKKQLWNHNSFLFFFSSNPFHDTRCFGIAYF